jgi:hypothetical protein
MHRIIKVCTGGKEQSIETLKRIKCRRTESASACKQEDTDAGRAKKCSRTMMRLVSHR